MRGRTCELKLNYAELGIIIVVLLELRNKHIAEGRPIDFLNEVIIKLNNA